MAFAGMPPWFRQLQIQYLHVRLRMMRRQQDMLLLALTVAEEEEAHRQRRPRTCWVKPWLQQRLLLGQYDTLIRELMIEAHCDFKRFLGQALPFFVIFAFCAPFFSRGMLVRYVFSSSRKQQINIKFFPATFVQVTNASSSQNVMSIWTLRHMFDQFSFTRFQ